MSTVKVSLGMPVYNGAQWLRQSIDSMLGQTYSDLELIISDNGSTDGTWEICKEYENNDERVRYFRNPINVGVFRNYDLAFTRSSGDYFKWCAAGDYCDPTFIERAVTILDESDDAVLVHSKTGLVGSFTEDPDRYTVELNLVDDDPAVRFRNYLSEVRLNNVMNGLIRSKCLGQTALNKVFHASDKCMMAELALRGKFVEIPEELFYRRMEAQTASILKGAEATRDFFANEPNSPATLSSWKTEFGLMSGVMRSPIDMSTKVSLIVYVLRRMNWSRMELCRELGEFLRIKSKSH